MGIFKAKEPMIPKELVWPANMVLTSSADPLSPVTLAKNAAQTTALPPVEGEKGPAVAVLEAAEPTTRGDVIPV